MAHAKPGVSLVGVSSRPTASWRSDTVAGGAVTGGLTEGQSQRLLGVSAEPGTGQEELMGLVDSHGGLSHRKGHVLAGERLAKHTHPRRKRLVF